jgi:hypothetical protein
MKSGRPLVSQPAQNNEPQAHFAKVGVQVKDLLARPLKVSHDPAVFPSKASHLNTKQDRCHFGRVRLTCAGGQWPRQTNAPESPKPLVSFATENGSGSICRKPTFHGVSQNGEPFIRAGSFVTVSNVVVLSTGFVTQTPKRQNGCGPFSIGNLPFTIQ